MTEPDYIHFEHHGEPFLSVFVYEHSGIDRRSSAVQTFRAEAKARLVPGMALGTGADDVPPGRVAPLLSFWFEPEHLAVAEEILEWLRAHPLVRLIETEHYRAARQLPQLTRPLSTVPRPTRIGPQISRRC